MSRGDGALYVYALAEPGLPRRFRLLGRSLRILSVGAVDVVAGRPDPIPLLTADAVAAQHDLVGILAQRASALLPARFGTLIAEEQLRPLLERRQAELLAALRAVRGRDQMCVRVFGAPVRSGEPEPATRSGAEFLRARRARLRRLPPEAAAVHEALHEVTAAERMEAGQGHLRLTAFHLVDRAAVPTYRRRASMLQDTLRPHVVRVTGPWPAFAFTPALL